MTKPRIAAIVTEYFVNSHADVIVGKYLHGIPCDDALHQPRVEIVSLYLDQVNARDIGLAEARQCGVPVFPSIRRALTIGGDKLAVDGVLIIGEHGEYATNEKGQMLYPRRHLFEQVAGALAGAGARLPVFNDKHLAYDWSDSLWMYQRARSLGLPFMAGSSLPTCWRRPFVEYPVDAGLTAAAVIGYGPLESYGFHALEVLQCMSERRKGGETGVAAVQCLEGAAIWRWLRENPVQGRLARAAAESLMHTEGTWDAAATHATHPAAFVIDYRDGLRAVVLMLNGYCQSFAFAGLGDGEIRATEFVLQSGRPHAHFSYLCRNIEEMFLSGTPTYPVERTLLTSGMLSAAMNSRYMGHLVLPTPHLDVSYAPSERAPHRPSDPAPTGATLAV